MRSSQHRLWSFRVNAIKGRVVTKAMLGRLSGNPNVLAHFLSRQPFQGNFDIWTGGRPLKRPILNDHVRGNQVRCTLRVACASVLFSLIFMCTC